MNYSVWLSWNNQKKEGFPLPVNPSSFEVSEKGKGSTYDINKVGEINMIQKPKLTSYSLEGILPAQKYSFVQTDLRGPVIHNGEKQNHYVYFITKWMKSERPIRFVLLGGGYDINEAVSIESFSWKDVAGSGGDLSYSLTLQKYVFFAARKVKLQQSEQSASPLLIKDQPARSHNKETPKTYTLIAGDTLWKVAQKQLGDGTRWKEIQAINNISSAELKRLRIGRVLNLP